MVIWSSSVDGKTKPHRQKNHKKVFFRTDHDTILYDDRNIHWKCALRHIHWNQITKISLRNGELAYVFFFLLLLFGLIKLKMHKSLKRTEWRESERHRIEFVCFCFSFLFNFGDPISTCVCRSAKSFWTIAKQTCVSSSVFHRWIIYCSSNNRKGICSIRKTVIVFSIFLE